MTPEQAWQQLLDLMEQSVPDGQEPGQPRLKWLPPNRLVLLGSRHVQARFTLERGEYVIHFERFGTEFGEQNFELPPGPLPTDTKWTMQLEISNNKVFWRRDHVQVQDSPELVRRVHRRLREYHDGYGM